MCTVRVSSTDRGFRGCSGSWVLRSVECMFDSLVAATAGARGASAVGGWARVESAACARRLAAMVALLDEAYAADGSAERDQWCVDNFDAVAAHIAATQCLTTGAAGNLLYLAAALHEQFPKVAAVFADGLISFSLVRTIITRTRLAILPDARRQIDDALAAACRTWEPMSKAKTEQFIDATIEQFDPDAVRRTQTSARGRSGGLHYRGRHRDGDDVCHPVRPRRRRDRRPPRRVGRHGVSEGSADEGAAPRRCVGCPGPRRGPAALPLRHPGLPRRGRTATEWGGHPRRRPPRHHPRERVND